MEERDLAAEPVPSKADYGSEQLIYSQWACGRKVLAGEGLVIQPDWGKPVLGPVQTGWVQDAWHSLLGNPFSPLRDPYGLW
jgi:hypothetical protein